MKLMFIRFFCTTTGAFLTQHVGWCTDNYYEQAAPCTTASPVCVQQLVSFMQLAKSYNSLLRIAILQAFFICKRLSDGGSHLL